MAYTASPALPPRFIVRHALQPDLYEVIDLEHRLHRTPFRAISLSVTSRTAILIAAMLNDEHPTSYVHHVPVPKDR
jgi:hypothetical protein